MPVIINGATGISGPDGSAATPAVQGTDTNTGIFFPAADTIAFAEGGAEVMRINSSGQVEYAAGTVTAPTIAPTGDLNTGIFFPAADTIAFTEGGVEALRLNSTGNAIFAGTVRAAGVAADIYPIFQATAQSPLIATADFTGIPAWVRRITIMFNSLSTNGTSNYLVQIGSGSITTSGYSSQGFQTASGGLVGAVSTAGFLITGTVSSTALYSGICTIANFSGTTWVSSGTLAGNAVGNINYFGGNSSALSGALDRVRITTVNGTDAFDAGSINIMYE